jgi:3-oxoacyl-[acyl-carrier-protein] synthase I
VKTIDPVGIRAFTLASACGVGIDALRSALAEDRSALRENDFADALLPCFVGRVDALESASLPPALARWQCRATRLAWLGLQADGFAAQVAAVRARCGASRIALVLGTSAATIAVSEQAYRTLDASGAFPTALRDPQLNTPHALALFVQEALALEGPALTVSTACSSSAQAFAVAQRWLQLGVADAVVVGGVDALCASLLYGFSALGLVSGQPCRPFDAARSGISVGEAAGFALLERGPAAQQLVGHGASNDAHHMSSPHPQGLGAQAALDDALARAGIDAAQVGYCNLHGTASALNDEVEAALVSRSYAPTLHASATKGLTGHTMGAAGIVEAVICLLALRDALLSGSAPTAAADPAMGDGFAQRFAPRARRQRIDFAASHSFGFGGNNAVLVFGRGR